MRIHFTHLLAAAAGVATLSAIAATAALAQTSLPEGPGREEVMAACNGCHAADVVVREQRTPERWASLITEMEGYGAFISADQRAAMVPYLAAHFGPPADTPAPAAPAAAPADAAPPAPAPASSTTAPAT